MKKVVPFSKQIPFNRTIAEITDIEVSHDLELKNMYEVEGNIKVCGKYKMTNASQIEDDFDYKLPFVIAIDSKYDTSNMEINISDFTFEIINEEELKINVDITLDNLIDKLDIDSIKNPEEREVEILEDVNLYNNEIGIKEDKELDEIKDDIKESVDKESDEKLDSIFKPNNNNEYSTYYVYIFRDSDTIEYLLDKYKISREELENYNDLSSITVGSKIIIPCSNE